jgi:ribosomal protein L40E
MSTDTILARDASVTTLEMPDGLDAQHVCPFCGAVSPEREGTCPRCKIDSSAASRSATKALIGPWYVLQAQNLSVPGIRFARLLELVQKGRIGPRSIVRGPTTHQFWRFAAQTRGLSREFGMCYSCGSELPSEAHTCEGCGLSQLPPKNPDVLVDLEDRGSTAKTAGMRNPEQPDWSHDVQSAKPSNGGDSNVSDTPEQMPSPSRPSGRFHPNDLLGTQEIAAAFNLDYSPPRRKGRGGRLLNGLRSFFVD